MRGGVCAEKRLRSTGRMGAAGCRLPAGTGRPADQETGHGLSNFPLAVRRRSDRGENSCRRRGVQTFLRGQPGRSREPGELPTRWYVGRNIRRCNAGGKSWALLRGGKTEAAVNRAILNLYTDGAFLDKIGCGAWAYHIPDLSLTDCGAMDGPSNVYFELLAAVRGLQRVKLAGRDSRTVNVQAEIGNMISPSSTSDLVQKGSIRVEIQYRSIHNR